MKKYIIGLIIIFILSAVMILIVGRVFFPDNIAETTNDGGKKELKTRIYRTDLETAKKTVKEIIPTLTSYGTNWKVVDETSGEANATVKAEVPVLIFVDDLEVKMERVALNGGVRVDVVSKSRVGKSDFGENARSVRKVLNALDEKLGKN